MSQSLVQNFMHIIFSTKDRKFLIPSEIENDLYKYLAVTCSNFKCHAQQIGGYLDHVHIVCNMSKNMAVADLVKELKTSSSKWIKYKYLNKDFYWQGGYAAYSVQYNNLEVVNAYVRNQHVPVSGSRDMIAAIKKSGGHPKYTEFEGAGHDIWSYITNTPGVLEWLFQQKRE